MSSTESAALFIIHEVTKHIDSAMLSDGWLSLRNEHPIGLLVYGFNSFCYKNMLRYLLTQVFNVMGSYMTTYVTRKKGKKEIQGNQLPNFGLVELFLPLIMGKLLLFFC